MICLTDNDIIWKLASCDLLPEAVTALGGTPAEVYVLTTARHVLLRPSKRGRGPRVPDGPARNRVAAFLASVQELPGAPEADLLAISGIPGIDPGEQQLFAATALYPDCRVLTGDKVCLGALAQAGDAVAFVRMRLRERVVCFEQTLLLLINELGFEEVRRRVVPAREVDKVLDLVFRAGLTTTAENAVVGLESYIAALRTEAPGLLVP